MSLQAKFSLVVLEIPTSLLGMSVLKACPPTQVQMNPGIPCLYPRADEQEPVLTLWA